MNKQASLSLELTGIIANLMLRSTSETLSDGTVTFTFKGILNPTQLHSIYLNASTSEQGTIRDTKKFIVYTGKGENYDWSVKQTKNYTNTRSFKVTFVMNDYTAVQ